MRQAPRYPLEHPVIVEAAERSFGVGHVDAPRRIERHARGETLAKDTETDDQVSDDQIGAAFLDSRRETPGQKLGITLDIGDERKELLRRVG